MGDRRRNRDGLYSVFVGHLHKSVTRSDLYQLFIGCGNIQDHCVLQDGPSVYNYGFVRYGKMEEARQALKELNGWPLKGIRIIVDVARDSVDRMRKQLEVRPIMSRVLLPLEATAKTRRNLSCIDKIENLSRVKEWCAFMNIEMAGNKTFASRSIALVDGIEAAGGSQLSHVVDPKLSSRCKDIGRKQLKASHVQWEINAEIPNSQLSRQFDQRYAECSRSLSGLLNHRSAIFDEGRSSPTINYRNSKKRNSNSPEQSPMSSPREHISGDVRNRIPSSDEEPVNIMPGFVRLEMPTQTIEKKNQKNHNIKGLSELLDIGKTLRRIESEKAKKKREANTSSETKSIAHDIRYCGELPEPGKLIHREFNEKEENINQPETLKNKLDGFEDEDDSDEDGLKDTWKVPEAGLTQEKGLRLAQELFCKHVSDSDKDVQDPLAADSHNSDSGSSLDSLDEIKVNNHSKEKHGEPQEPSSMLHFSRGERNTKTSFSKFTNLSSEESSTKQPVSVRLSKLAELLRKTRREAMGATPLE